MCFIPARSGEYAESVTYRSTGPRSRMPLAARSSIASSAVGGREAGGFECVGAPSLLGRHGGDLVDAGLLRPREALRAVRTVAMPTPVTSIPAPRLAQPPEGNRATLYTSDAARPDFISPELILFGFR
jgi:hypothetical protein